MLRHIDTVEGSIVKYYPNTDSATLVLRAAFYKGWAEYTLDGKGRYSVPPLLSFKVLDSGERVK